MRDICSQIKHSLLITLCALAILGMTGCSENNPSGVSGNSTAESQGSPVTTIVYGGENYYGLHLIGKERPEGLISTGTYTGPGDYMPYGLEIYYIPDKPDALYVLDSGPEPGSGEWVEYLAQDNTGGQPSNAENTEAQPEVNQP